MRFSKWMIRAAAVAFGLAVLAPLSTLAQTIGGVNGTDPVVPRGPLPARSARMATPPHHRGTNSMLFGRVRNGVYTVDGMVAKVQLNYDVNGASYLYLFDPGVGTAVVGLLPDAEGSATAAHLEGNDLLFSAGDHTFKLSGIALVNDRGNVPDKLYVRFDHNAWNLGRRPMVGFGDAAELPYVWPGVIAPAAPMSASEENPLAPPVPRNLLPSTRTVTPAAAATPVAVNPASLHPASLH